MADGFDIRITYKMIVAAARDRRVMHYKPIIDEHGMGWPRARSGLNPHLDKILQISFERKWPALTAIIVPKDPGYLTGKGLKGFCESAKRAGYEFDDDEAFAREQMEAVFDWAQTADPEFTIESNGDEDRKADEDDKRDEDDHCGGGFDIRTTYRMIVAAARERRVIHYEDITDAHGMEMERVLTHLFRHLDKVLEVSFERDWPALTAIIVPVRTDHLSGKGLEGFCESARRAGYEFDDCETFAREQMEAVFDWAPTADAEFEITNGGSKDSNSPTGTKSRYFVIIGLILAVGIAVYYAL